MKPCWIIVAILVIVIIILIVVRPPGTTGEKGITVVLNTTATNPIHPDPADLRRSTSVDHLRWDNQTGQQVVIKFREPARWPFVEAYREITLPAGSKSEWFTLAPGAQGPAAYFTEPDVSGPGPDEPVITAGD